MRGPLHYQWNQHFGVYVYLSGESLTIPANILTQLPASPAISAGGFSIVTRGVLSVGLSGNGVRVTASGLDYFLVSDNTTTSVTTQYQ